MKQQADIEAMIRHAQARRLYAKDLHLIGGISDEIADRRRAFANGVEAALLWVMDNGGDIWGAPIQLRPPIDISDEDLDNLPGLAKES